MNPIYKTYMENLGEFGLITEVNHPIVAADGLPGIKPQELVIFEDGKLGEVFTIHKDKVEILLLSQESVKTGIQVVRTGKSLSIPVGQELLGHVIDPLGNPISPTAFSTKPAQYRFTDQAPLGISQRKRITKPFKTGVALVDLLIPIGKGQRELIVGDRKSGKSSFLLTAITNQVKHGAIAIYAAIGKKVSDIKKLQEYFIKQGLMDKVIIVAASSIESPSLIYLTPYTAMTIAEYFRDLGQETVVVFDDLSTHAKFYREISLLAKNFPGRDSYPGDIFNTHARLLERAGNFIHKDKGEVSITCIPVVETVEGDLTGYIATNIMSMTDGHIFFDSNIYFQGRRPAININLSVTRVGKQTQTPPERDANRELTAFVTLYERMQNLSHFGAELSDRIKIIMSNGNKIFRYFDQQYTVIVPSDVQLVFFALLWIGFLDNFEVPLEAARINMTNAYNESLQIQEQFKTIVDTQSFNSLLGNVTKQKDILIPLCKNKAK